MSTLRVLFATSEAYPLAKTGGLGDVSYALPTALRQLGVDARLLLPGYPSVMQQLLLIEVHENLTLFPSVEPARLLAGFMPGGAYPVYVIDCPKLYARAGGPYQDTAGNEWPDNAVRFAVLSKIAAMFGSHQFLFKPDILHCNDWQTGLAPAFLAHSQTRHRARSVMSVHNMAYQGVYGPELAEFFGQSRTDMIRVVKLLGLPESSFSMNGLEYHGKMSFLKAGLHYSDWITTVSPTYAKDIQTEAFGYGLQGLLATRSHQLSGILNGIDIDAWNPATDRYIVKNYSIDTLADKDENKRILRGKLGLEQAPNKPLLGMITRLTYQKGLDLLVPIIPDIVHEGVQLVLLGSGDKELENRLKQYARLLPSQISVTLGYDEQLSHQIIAASDMFLMPSLFEPCGLTQMYSMRYGTIPLVRRTGGLADTVIDATLANIQNHSATGFVFEEEDSQQLFSCIQRALKAFHRKDLWPALQSNGMTHDFSWYHSAHEYVALYQQLLIKN